MDTTDFVVVSLAFFVGAFFGASVLLPVGGTRILLGSSVGTLLAGVVAGYIRSVRPIFGRVPEAAVPLMQSLGLSGAVAMVRLGAGPDVVPAVREAGLGLRIGGVFVTLAPLTAGIDFGRYVTPSAPSPGHRPSPLASLPCRRDPGVP